MSTGSKRAFRKVGNLVEIPVIDSSFIRIIGPADGCGPYRVTYNNVSPQLLMVMENIGYGLKDELLTIIQNGEEGDVEVELEEE